MLGRWSHDVAYLIGSALPTDTRAFDERALLSHYLERLRAHGADAPADETAWNDCRRAMMYGLFGWLTNLVYFQPEEVSARTCDRYAKAVIELDTIDLLMG